MRTHVFRLLDSCVSQKGICPQSMFVILSCIGVLDAGGPIQRYHSWLVRARRKCPDASKLSTNPPDGSCRARNILPTHLPVYPRGNVFPKSRPARIRYFAACNAWTAVEWIIAAHNYYELGCPKSPAEYEKEMGGWKISRVERDLVLDLFEGLTPFFRIRSNEGWSRGRKSSH